MTLRPNSVVYELIYDEKTGRASGVRVLDAETNEQLEFRARVIFLCASTFGSTFILLNSTSSRFPNGFGNDSGELGCNLMDHQLDVGASAIVEGFDDQYYTGRRPNGDLHSALRQHRQGQARVSARFRLPGRRGDASAGRA